MSAPVIGPAMRPCVIVLVGEVGQHMYEHLTDLFSGLDRSGRRGIAIVRYNQTRAERLPLTEAQSDDEEAPEDDGTATATAGFDPLGADGGAGFDSAFAAPAPSSFRTLLKQSVEAVQWTVTVRRLRRDGLSVLNPLAHFIIAGSARDPQLDTVSTEVRAALRELVTELGTEHTLDTQIIYTLCDYGTEERTFKSHLATGRTEGMRLSTEDVQAWLRQEPPTSDASGSALEMDDFAQARGRWGQTGTAYAGVSLDGSEADFDARTPNPRVTFAFLWSRMVPGSQELLTPEQVEYIAAEAVFALSATGLSETPALQQLMTVVPGVSALEYRVGAMGVCMIRFPRAAAEKYCANRLGGEVLKAWSEREFEGQRRERRAEIEARKEAQREAARRFVESVLEPWLGDILSPPSGPDGWPDLDAFPEEAIATSLAVDALNGQLERLLSRDEIERRIARLDYDDRAQRDPRKYAALWSNVTDPLRRERQDIVEARWSPLITRLYEYVRDDLVLYLDRHIDDIWLNAQQGWQAAAAYAEELSEELVNILLENLAEQRRDRFTSYQQQLSSYDHFRDEAGADEEWNAGGEQADGGDPLERGEEIIEARFDRARRSSTGGMAGEATYGGNANSPSDLSSLGEGVRPGDIGGEPNESNLAGEGAADDGAGFPTATSAEESATAWESDDAEPLSQREERLLRAVDQSIAARAVAERVTGPAIGWAVAAWPALVLLLRAPIDRIIPAEGPATLLSVVVSTTLLALLGIAAQRVMSARTEEARRAHVALTTCIATYHQQELEDQLRVFVVNQALANTRDARENLRNWPDRVKNLADKMQTDATKASQKLFEGPAGSHDIFVANGAVLETDLDDGGAGERDPAEALARSPLAPVYYYFTAQRLHHATEFWHSDLDAILDTLRESFHASNGGVLRMSADDFSKRVGSFLRANFHQYLRGEIGHIRKALDPTTNPDAYKLWASARERAAPLHATPGAEMRFIVGQTADLKSTQNLRVEPQAQLLATKPCDAHQEWLLTSTIRRGGITL